MNLTPQTQKPDYTLLVVFVVFTIGVFVSFSRLAFRSTINQVTTPLNKTKPLPTQTMRKLNLKLPIRCELTQQDATYSAQLRGDKAHLRVQKGSSSQLYIYDDGCLYSWESQTKKGTKQCGFANAFAMGKQFFESGLVDPSTIFPALSSVKNPMLGCKNVATVDSAFFEVPKNIFFQEEKK